MSQYISYKDWNPSSIGCAKKKANSGGQGSSALINNGKGRPLDLIAPADMLCWGAEQGKDNNGELVEKYHMSLQFPSADYPNEEHTKFLEKVKQCENQILTMALQNREEWFGFGEHDENTSKVLIRSNFESSLRYPNIKGTPAGTKKPDMTKAPSLKVKLPVWQGTWKFRIFNETNHQTFPSEDPDVCVEVELPKLSRVTAFIRCGGLWFVGAKWGVKWNLMMAVVKMSDYDSSSMATPGDLIDFGIEFKSDAPSSVTPAANSTVVPASTEEDDGIVHDAVATVVVTASAPVVQVVEPVVQVQEEIRPAEVVAEPVAASVAPVVTAAPAPVAAPLKKKTAPKKAPVA